MKLIVRLARSGLIHGDFNEFNLLIKESKETDQDYQDQDQEEIDQDQRKSERVRGNGIKVEEMRDRLNEVEKDGDDLGLGFDLRGKAQFRRNGGLLKLDRNREVVENGNGFQRIVSVKNDDDEDDSEESEDDDDEDEDEDDDGEREEEEEKIHFKDGTVIEPVLIDFPQMVSVEHENAE